MKKIFLVILMLFVVTGCNNNDVDETQTPTEPQQENYYFRSVNPTDREKDLLSLVGGSRHFFEYNVHGVTKMNLTTYEINDGEVVTSVKTVTIDSNTTGYVYFDFSDKDSIVESVRYGSTTAGSTMKYFTDLTVNTAILTTSSKSFENLQSFDEELFFFSSLFGGLNISITPSKDLLEKCDEYGASDFTLMYSVSFE